MIIQDTLLSGLLCGLAGCVVMVLGYTCKQRTIMIMGAIAALLAMAYEFYTLFGAIDLYSWTSLSVIGVSAIVIGSLIERHGVALKFRISQWLKHFEKSGLENQKV